MSDEENFEVETIVDKKIEGDKQLYLIKWKGYPESDNTWEPFENLTECAEQISQFELAQVEGEPSKDDNNRSEVTDDIPLLEGKSGVKLGYSVKDIKGILKVSGQRFCVVQWKEEKTQELVAADVVEQRYPKAWIRFMEKRLAFKTSS